MTPLIVPTPDLTGTDLELRAQVDPLEALHQLRRVLMVQLAPLRALHSHQGLWDAKRKAMLSAIEIRIRMDLTEKQEKATDSKVDAMAHSDSQYLDFLENGVTDRIAYLTLSIELDEYEEKIRNRELCLMAYSAEARLAR